MRYQKTSNDSKSTTHVQCRTWYTYINTSARDTINSHSQAITNTKHIRARRVCIDGHTHRFSGKAEQIQHYIETNNGGMAIADIATTSLPKLPLARSLAHRLVSIPEGKHIIIRTTLQRASQIKGIPNFRKSRECLQVPKKVPKGTCRYLQRDTGRFHPPL